MNDVQQSSSRSSSYILEYSEKLKKLYYIVTGSRQTDHSIYEYRISKVEVMHATAV